MPSAISLERKWQHFDCKFATIITEFEKVLTVFGDF